jgi:hypothetical protein
MNQLNSELVNPILYEQSEDDIMKTNLIKKNHDKKLNHSELDYQMDRYIFKLSTDMNESLLSSPGFATILAMTALLMTAALIIGLA